MILVHAPGALMTAPPPSLRDPPADLFHMLAMALRVEATKQLAVYFCCTVWCSAGSVGGQINGWKDDLILQGPALMSLLLESSMIPPDLLYYDTYDLNIPTVWFALWKGPSPLLLQSISSLRSGFHLSSL